jgi:quinol monooxygenase YgiN
MHFLPEAVPEFLEIWKTSRTKIRAQPGCQEARLYQDHANPNIYYTFSRWATAADLEAYRKSGLFGDVWPRTKALFAHQAEAHSLVSVPDGAE